MAGGGNILRGIHLYLVWLSSHQLKNGDIAHAPFFEVDSGLTAGGTGAEAGEREGVGARASLGFSFPNMLENLVMHTDREKINNSVR